MSSVQFGLDKGFAHLGLMDLESGQDLRTRLYFWTD